MVEKPCPNASKKEIPSQPHLSHESLQNRTRVLLSSSNFSKLLYLNGTSNVQRFLHARNVKLDNSQVFAFDNDGAQEADKTAMK